jgi:hypothetical protein
LDEPLDEDEEDTNEWEMIHYSAGTTEHEVIRRKERGKIGY